MSIREKVWFITGCSTGFGRELAKETIERGDKVAVTARNLESILDLADGREEQVLPLQVDVTKREEIEAAVQKTISQFQQIDVLVNNAGIGYFSSVEEGVEEETRKMFEVNFWGLMNVTNAVLPHMRSQRSGHIFNFSSIGGLASFPSLGYYHATKYAVEGISESLAQELKPFNIAVTLIEPSAFRTDWSGRSSVKTASSISEYQEFLAPMYEGLGKGQEEGDPVKAAKIIADLANHTEPPLRLLLGTSAYQVSQYKFSQLMENIEKWKDITLSVDFQKNE